MKIVSMLLLAVLMLGCAARKTYIERPYVGGSFTKGECVVRTYPSGSFLTFLIWPGYQERIGDKIYRRWPGMILWRPAKFTHSVFTSYGTSWSLVLLLKKSNEWSFKECRP